MGEGEDFTAIEGPSLQELSRMVSKNAGLQSKILSEEKTAESSDTYGMQSCPRPSIWVVDQSEGLLAPTKSLPFPKIFSGNVAHATCGLSARTTWMAAP